MRYLIKEQFGEWSIVVLKTIMIIRIEVKVYVSYLSVFYGGVSHKAEMSVLRLAKV